MTVTLGSCISSFVQRGDGVEALRWPQDPRAELLRPQQNVLPLVQTVGEAPADPLTL